MREILCVISLIVKSVSAILFVGDGLGWKANKNITYSTIIQDWEREVDMDSKNSSILLCTLKYPAILDEPPDCFCTFQIYRL